MKHRGIQASCGTEDDERPVECTMTATRKGRVLGSEAKTIAGSTTRTIFRFKLTPKDKRKLRLADPPIEIRLRLEVRDEAGNVGREQKTIRLVKDLFG